MVKLSGRLLLCLTLLAAQMGVASGAIMAVPSGTAEHTPCPHHAERVMTGHEAHAHTNALQGSCQHDSQCQCEHIAAASLLPAQPDLFDTPWHEALTRQTAPPAPALVPPAKPWRPPSRT